ncbi:HD-like signal output (HDOD) domain, no enzymatic activity [Modestobacter sp. DSM 44400]|uniref:HDOD domain-containing protein n=1 Tax=Modestobacter sp. DSM 44400 TaxID=1550230 RepID=UPI000898955C|nr:HDOD domain-containing protein [Modestobacter sp. DSM 44400]SDX83977.1 HD-like signal output (HDOD) domain, no enzymatic activity [Modestobacter sp. DSM 44400]
MTAASAGAATDVSPTLAAVPVFDIERVLAGIDTMAAQRPVAAQVVSAANADSASAKELSRILSLDVPLAGRVMKLANSAYFGMRGRVTSLQLAVTVVGFTTVRTMATVALTDLHDEFRLPEDFWEVSTTVALSAATLAPKFGERPQDALCLGLLAQLGVALLHHNDTDGYAELTAGTASGAARRAAEVQRYGISALRLTSVALEEWGFPASMVLPPRHVEDFAAVDGALLRASFEVAARLCTEGHEPVPMSVLSGGQLAERDLTPLLETVRTDAEELRRALLG